MLRRDIFLPIPRISEYMGSRWCGFFLPSFSEGITEGQSFYNLYFSLSGTGGLPMSKDVRTTSEYADELGRLYRTWRTAVTATKSGGSNTHVDFHPGIIPRIWRDYMEYHPLFALPLESRDGFVKMAKMARELSELSLDTNMHIVWITSWNEWCERTTIEPTRTTAPDYPFGNVGYDLVETAKEVFGK